MAKRSIFSSLFNKASKSSLGYRGRESFAYKPRQGLYGFERQADDGMWTFDNVSYKDFRRKPLPEKLRLLVDNSDAMSSAVSTYKHFIYQGHELIADNDDAGALKIIEEFISGIEDQGDSLEGLIEQFSYSLIVEGGLCGELYFDNAGELPLNIGVISPFSLVFKPETDEDHKDFHIIGQNDARGTFKPLFDKRDPNDTFVYIPVGQKPGKPYGASPVAPAIFGILSNLELLDMTMSYTRGQAFPRGIISIDIKDFVDAEYPNDEINQMIDDTVEQLDSHLSGADETQSAVIGTKIINTLIGALNRANLDGVEMMIAILERVQQRGLKVPRILFGGERRGGAIGDTEGRIEWQSFQGRLRNYRVKIQNAFKRFFRPVLRHYGNPNDVSIKFDESDEEGRRIVAERLKIEVDGYSTMVADRVITQQEYRALIFNSDERFSDFDVDLPEELAALPEPVEPVWRFGCRYRARSGLKEGKSCNVRQKYGIA